MKSGSLTIPAAVVLAFLAIWVLYAVSFSASPLYADSLFTVGAGAHLASEGHFSSTFMLYGLISPFTLEVLLRLGFARSAPDVLRLFEFMVCLAAVGLIASGTRQLIPGKPKSVIFVALFTLLSSVVLMIESLELTPEILTLFSLAGLFRACMLYKEGRRDTLRLAVWLALLVGSRPTGFVLGLPAFLTIAATAPSDSWMRRIWSRSVLLVLISASVLAAFPGMFSSGLLAMTALPLILLITIFCWVHDFRTGDRAQWTDLVRMVFLAAGAIALLFPHYILHFTDLQQQILQFHILVEQPAGSIFILGRNLILGIGYLTIVLIGPLASVGFFAFIGYSIRGRIRYVQKLTPFLLGTIPFFFLIMRNEGFQPRYLIPLMIAVSIPATLGLLTLLRQRKLKYLLLLPLSLSLLQTGEAVYYRGWKGGILNTFKDIPDAAGTVSWHNVFPCNPMYYNQEVDIPWPLHPYLPLGMETTAADDDASFILAFREIPEDFEEIRARGVTGLKSYWVQIRESAHPDLATALRLMGKPWTWRLCSVSILGTRIR